jgi:hypothetical protein
MDSLSVLTEWAQLQSDRELSMLRLAMAYHMHKSGLSTLTVAPGELSALVESYKCTITLDVSGGMFFTLNPRTGAASAAPA